MGCPLLSAHGGDQTAQAKMLSNLHKTAMHPNGFRGLEMRIIPQPRFLHAGTDVGNRAGEGAGGQV